MRGAKKRNWNECVFFFMAFPWRKWRQNIATFILATLSVFAANRQIWLWYTYSLDKQSVSTYYNNCSLLLGYSISLCTRKILSSILCIIFLCNKTELVQTIVDFTVSKFCLFWKNTIFTLISILHTSSNSCSYQAMAY